MTTPIAIRRRPLMAFDAERAAVADVESMLRVKSERQDVIGVKPDAVAGDGARTTASTRVIVAQEYGIAPFAVSRCLSDALVLRRDASLPIRGALAALAFAHQSSGVSGVLVATPIPDEPLVPRPLPRFEGGSRGLGFFRSNTSAKSATARTEAPDFWMAARGEQRTAPLASLHADRIVDEAFTGQKAQKVGEAVGAS